MWSDAQQYLQTNANQYCGAFAKELGPVLGGGMTHSGKTLGFPGFDVGIRMPIKNIGNDFVFKSSDVTMLGLPMVQAEIGLPGKIDIIARMAPPAENISMMGVGVRYGIIKSGLPGIPSISVLGSYNKLSTDMLEVTTLSANVAVSFGLIIVTPYVNVGIDQTEVKATAKALAGTPLTSASGTASTTRLEAGITFSPLPLIYIYGGYVIIGDSTGYNVGAGLRF
jgi:opacity protein-like surface antigen